MRFLTYLTSILVFTLLVACGGGGGTAGTNASTPTTVAGAFSISAPTTLALGVSSVSTYQVSGGTLPYSVGSSDTRVAVASISGGVLTINAVKSGSATLVLLDATGKSISLIVTVDGASASSAVASIEILPSSISLTSAAGSSISFAVTVKDASNSTIPNQTITFVASSGSLVGANPAPLTGSSGTNTAVTLSPGADQSNRNISVTVTADKISKSVVVPVTGTRVSISGPGSTLIGALASSYTVKAIDSAGKPIRGAKLAIASSLGNAVSSTEITTDLSGTGSVNFIPSKVGSDTLTVTGLGATGQTSVAVSDEDFLFITPSPSQELAISTTISATVSYKVSGVPQVGKSVYFSTTRGNIIAGPVNTDANGQAATQLSSTTAGPVTVSAQVGSTRTTVASNFVSASPSWIFLQANPNAILPNEKGSVANQSALTATVKDASGNPVPNQTVNFTALQDLSNGYINPVSAVTDSSGIATSQFISGPLSTPSNGVKLRASVHNTSVESTATMTVNGEALFISIGLSNLVEEIDQTTYGQTLSVYVVDAIGAPAGNRAISLSAYPLSYGKGRLAYDELASPPGWKVVSYTGCPNEDLDRNGIYSADKDRNHDGVLWPGLPVALVPSALITNNNGFAQFKVSFGKNYALWINLEVTARAFVSGTESRKVLTTTLAPPLTAVSSQATPPFSRSPFGVQADCADPN